MPEDCQGLTVAEAARRLAEVGPNSLPETAPTRVWRRFVRQFKGPLIYILLFALVFDLGVWVKDGASDVPVEGLAIAAVLLFNAILGAYQEQRSEYALTQLRSLTAPTAWALRDGTLIRLPSSELVPGDVIRVEAGERIPADGTLAEGVGIMVDEAVLTGESMPVDKALEAEVHSGTLLVRGKGLLRVTATGARSAMGKLATLLGEIKVEKTPLEKRLGVVGHQIARAVGGLVVLLAVLGVVVEGLGRFEEVVLFAVALAVAAVPEGMPAVVTLTLALGVQRMARRHAVVRRLSAVEALGSVTVIATDKTGTLTENRMSVRALESDDPARALLAMTLANDAEHGGGAGDPLELGLVAYARAQGVDVAALRQAHPRRTSRPFDSAWRYMRVTVEAAHGLASYFKGAPEVILERAALSEADRVRWLGRAEAAANQGYRVLALAASEGERETGLELLGLVMLWDPPRPEVPAAIAKARAAGVRVVMITGDHPGTARAVAQAVGIEAEETLSGTELDGMSDAGLAEAVRRVSVFARFSAQHKLRLVEALKADGEIVAMTGDGVNDAPALRRADVGIAMGQRGSDVAREVADLVLLDDNLASIVGAIEEGRGIYENIQTFIRFTFSANVALVLLVVTGAISAYADGLRNEVGMLFLPLTALQLLWINFLGDGPPALALALDRNPDVMKRPPRPPKSALLDGPSLLFIFVTGLFKGGLGIALLLVLPAVGYTMLAVQTMLFLYESVAKLVSAYPARKLVHRPQRNLALTLSVAFGLVLQLLTLVVPPLRRVLGLVALDWRAVLTLMLAVAATWSCAELTARILSRRRPPPRAAAQHSPPSRSFPITTS